MVQRSRVGRERGESRLFYGFVIVALGFVCMLVSAGLWDSFGVFVKPFQDAFGWSRAAISAAYSVSFIVFGVTGVIAGWLTDRFGPRGMLSICAVSLALGYFLLSRLSGLWELFLFEGVLLGFGMSGMYAPLLGIVARWFTGLRGVMTGVLLAGLGAGQLVGPAVIGRLTTHYGWRSLFVLMAITVFVVLIAAIRFLRRDPAEMGLVPYGSSAIPPGRSPIAPSGGSPQPPASVSQPPAAFYSLGEAVRTWQLWAMWLVKVCYGYYMFSFVVHIVPHATDLGMSPGAAATTLSFSGAGIVIGSFGLGRSMDLLGPRKVILGCFGTALVMMVFLLRAQEPWMVWTIAFVVGLANGGLMTADAPMCVGLFGLRSVGAIIGTSSGAFSLGSALGPAVTGLVFDRTGSYQTAFVIMGVFCVAGFVLALTMRPTARLKCGI